MLKRGLSGSTLKWIALLTMLIDHTAVVIMYGSAAAGRQVFSSAQYYALRCVGRLAFPIYAFLLAEGFHHTRSVKKYLLRLLLFGMFSEIPFDLAFNFSWIDWSYQNVYFTLFLGLLAVWLWECATRGKPAHCGAGRILLGLLGIASATVAAGLFKTDYGIWGVLVIVSFALFRNREWQRNILAGCFLLGSSVFEAVGLVDFVFFHFYNGQRGRQVKKFFYVFYPAHLFLLWLLRCLVYAI